VSEDPLSPGLEYESLQGQQAEHTPPPKLASTSQRKDTNDRRVANQGNEILDEVWRDHFQHLR
tara:strand:+ start:566 stop:754 length:189 start_codon:yes stop_codon:yes gene_type:complete